MRKTAADVTQLLHEDHQKVRELFFAFSKSEDSNEKKELVQQILTELYIHSTVEEEIVYPNVKEEVENDGEELTEEAIVEHRTVKFLMAELSKMEPDEEGYDSKVTVLCELVNHHVREEEKEMFKKLRESDADLNSLAAAVQERKSELQSRPLPSMQATLEIGRAAGEEENEEEEEEGEEEDEKSGARPQTRSRTQKGTQSMKGRSGGRAGSKRKTA